MNSVWNIQNHQIRAASDTHFPPLAREISQIIKQSNHTDTPVFLRGGILESSAPHPKSDIDLIIVSPTLKHNVSLEALKTLDRFIDVHVLSPTRNSDIVYHTLLHTRSIQILGTPMVQQNVLIDAKWLYHHWLTYGVNRLPRVLNGSQPRRVQEVKMLLRSVALIWYMKNHMFSRSLDTCLSWLELLHPQFAVHMSNQLSCLDNPIQAPFEVSQLCDWLSKNFYELWDNFP